MNFLQGQIVFQTNPEYNVIYEHMREQYGVKYQQLFLFATIIGFKNKRKTSYKYTINSVSGREIRSNFFKPDEQNIFYSLILSEESFNKDINQFNNSDMILEYRHFLEHYANGGMEILIEEVFREKWISGKLDVGFNDYDHEISLYVVMQLNGDPF